MQRCVQVQNYRKRQKEIWRDIGTYMDVETYREIQKDIERYTNFSLSIYIYIVYI